jgi:hypothetical protein
MKSLAILLILLSLLGFSVTLIKLLSITIEHPAGLLNPTLHIMVDKSEFVLFLIWAMSVAASVYIYLLICWVEKSLAVTTACISSMHDYAPQGQPLELPRLKESIRAGDVDSVTENATWAALSYRNDDFLSPYELAELYGNTAVISALLGAYRREHLMHMISDNIVSLNREMPGWYFVE